MVLVCNSILQDHMIKRSFDSGIIINLVCHVIFQDHVSKGHVVLWVGTLHGKAPPCHVWLPYALW